MTFPTKELLGRIRFPCLPRALFALIGHAPRRRIVIGASGSRKNVAMNRFARRWTFTTNPRPKSGRLTRSQSRVVPVSATLNRLRSLLSRDRSWPSTRRKLKFAVKATPIVTRFARTAAARYRLVRSSHRTPTMRTCRLHKTSLIMNPPWFTCRYKWKNLTCSSRR